MNLVYVASPYSRINDKEALMKSIADFSGFYMINHPGEYAITGLINHYAACERPDLGTDFNFWENFCVGFINMSKKVAVRLTPGWFESIGVIAEIKLATRLGIPVEYWISNAELREEREFAESIFRPSMYHIPAKFEHLVKDTMIMHYFKVPQPFDSMEDLPS